MSAHIRLKDVSFSYPVYDISGRSLKVSLVRGLKRSHGDRGFVEVQALSDLTFDIEWGDRLGLIGHNGAGKSTLLRLLAGLVHPSQGSLDIKGRVAPLIAKGLGIHPELRGIENVEVPMRLLGATEREIAAAKRDIAEFSGLGDRIHMPVRTYSDGMRARLMFAICTAVRGDILLMDEWLSAGDADFVLRAQARMNELMATTGIVVLSSHSAELVASLCNKVCWMEGGRVVLIGESRAVIEAYTDYVSRANALKTAAE